MKPSEEVRKQPTTGGQHSQGQVQIQAHAIWSQNLRGHVPDEDGPHHEEVPGSHKHT